MSGMISDAPAQIFLRPIRPEDLDVLEAWENDPAVWAATDFSTWAKDERPPYSLAALRQFIDNQQLGIDRNGQLRLVICLRDDLIISLRDDASPPDDAENFGAGSPVPSPPPPLASSPSAPRPLGFVDLFDYDPRARTAEVGMLIYRTEDRGRGYGSQALELACDHAFGTLGMRELRCTAAAENFASRRVFEKCGFVFTENRARLEKPQDR